MRISIQQRILPHYRMPFFARLAERYQGQLTLYAGDPLQSEGVRGPEQVTGIRLHRLRNLHLRGRSGYTFCWQAGFLRSLRAATPEVAVLEANPRILSNHCAIRLLRSRGSAVVGWGLGALEWSVPTYVAKVRTHLVRRYHRNFDVVIGYGRSAADAFKALGVPSNRIRIAPNSTSGTLASATLRQIQEHPELVGEWKVALGLANRPIVLFVGRLVPEKRLDVLLQACARLAGQCQLMVVGEGPEKHRLEEHAARLGQPARFLGHRAGSEVARCFAVADVVVMPGSGGLVVQEAMSYGKAVIVGPGETSGHNELVSHGVNGFRLATDSVDELVERLNACLADANRLRTMGQESLTIVSGRHNLEVMVDAFCSALEDARAIVDDGQGCGDHRLTFDAPSTGSSPI